MNVVLASIGYGLAFALFAALALLLAVSWRGGRVGLLLIAAAALTACWAAVLAVEPHWAVVGPAAVTIVELLRDGAWLLFLTTLLRGARLRLLTTSIGAIWIGAFSLAVATLLPTGFGRLLAASESLIMAGLLLSVATLVLLEQLYRNTTGDAARSRMKYLVIALALVSACDLYVYSEAMLLGGIQPAAWLARGYVTALGCPLIAVAARRHADWSVDLYVSRNATFYATVVTGIGVYLVLMAATGYGIRFYGGGWGALAQLVFVAGAGGLLGLLLLSQRARRDLRVLLNKHFYRSRYDYRSEWLRFAEALAAPRDKEGLRAAAIESVARIVDAPSGLLWAEDAAGEAYEVVSSWPEPVATAQRVAKSEDFVSFIRRTKWIVDLEQHRLEPQLYDHVPVPESWREVGACLVVPLFLRDELLGLVTLSGSGFRAELNYEDHDLLKTLGSQIATYLRQDDIQRRLLVSQQFEAYHRLAAFMVHDLKNLIAQQSLVLQNAQRHRANPAFVDDVLSAMAGSVGRMQRMLGKFHSREAGEERCVALSEVLAESLRRCAGGRPQPRLSIEGAAAVRCDPDRFATALEHVIRNAQQATSRGGCVSVRARAGDGKVVVVVQDDGAGMDEAFIRNRLFNPFDSTKGVEGMGIGAYQAREVIRSMGGTLAVTSTLGVGTTVRIELPAETASAGVAPAASDVSGGGPPERAARRMSVKT